MRLGVLRRDKLFVVFRNLIVVEALVYLAFLGLALSADWGEIYEGFAVSNYIRFEIIEFSLLGLAQLGLIILVFARSLGRENDIKELINSGEHERLEFKTSLRWDAKRNQVNKELEKTIMKTVAAFLNSEGGCLLIGINDSGEPIGLENDFITLAKPNTDGFENHFNNLFNSMIGAEFRRFVKLTFNNINGKVVCLANVQSSHKPAYLKTENGENFYIRTGNVTTPLKMSEVTAYVSSWWSK
jgi:hypothetical protein